ncbi:MAG: hypothetical protein LBP55_00245 [Candidatus Adiutrix sp.]|jgi:succinate-acetate transporter protein|nr:hypothetical protein [Candidatus Adiutrix sp.]
MEENSIGQKLTFASGGPTALFTLGFYVILLWPIATGRVDPSLAGVIVPMGIIIAVIQLICGIIELRNGNLLGGTIPLAFSCFMAMGAGETLLKINGLMPADSSLIDGYAMTLMGLMMAVFVPIVARAPVVVFLFYLANACFFTPAGLGCIFNIPALVVIGNTIMIAVCPLAVWIGVAQVYEAELGRSVVWLGKPLIK